MRRRRLALPRRIRLDPADHFPKDAPVLSEFAVILYNLLGVVVGLIVTLLIVSAVLSWLIAFDVVDRRNRFIAAIWDFTNRMTEPMLRPIRAFMPNLGGIDLAPLVLIIGLQFVVMPVVGMLLRAIV